MPDPGSTLGDNLGTMAMYDVLVAIEILAGAPKAELDVHIIDIAGGEGIAILLARIFPMIP